MGIPHIKEHGAVLRKLPHKGAILLAVAAAACLLVLNFFSFSAPSTSPFEAVATNENSVLKWVFITPYGENDPSYRSLFPSQEDCANQAGMPVEITFCAMEKYLNMTAAGMPTDVVTCWYTDPNFKRLETTGSSWSLQELLDEQIPGFTLPNDFVQWCGNFQGHVYAYPHTRTILSQDISSETGTVVIARKDLLEKLHWEKGDSLSKDSVLEQLKTVRKAYPDLTPCYMDFSSLQQMFGVRAETGMEWEDPFFHPGTLEALQYMNTLYRERLLSPDVFTISQETLLTQLENGEIFLASSSSLGNFLSLLPEDHPIWEQYEEVSPILSDSGREPAFANNFDEQYASTLFVKDSAQSQAQARLLAGFYLRNMELSQEQETALQAAGLGNLLNDEYDLEPVGMDSQNTVPITHYEILFSHYSNTRLATAAERKNTYVDTQTVYLVEDCSPDEIQSVYNNVVWELRNGDFKLLQTWKENRYQKAMDILQNRQPTVETLSY